MTISAVGPSNPTTPLAAPAAPSSPLRAPTDETASLNLDQLAGAIGLHPDEVLRRLANGEGLGDRLSAAADTNYGSTVGALIRGGILVDRYA
jgi:hypothetical protein